MHYSIYILYLINKIDDYILFTYIGYKSLVFFLFHLFDDWSGVNLSKE